MTTPRGGPLARRGTRARRSPPILAASRGLQCMPDRTNLRVGGLEGERTPPAPRRRWAKTTYARHRRPTSASRRSMNSSSHLPVMWYTSRDT